MEKDSDLQVKTATNLLWSFVEKCGSQGVAFVVSIILARLLEPSDYGTIALVTVFTNVLQVFVNHGLGNALIQKKNADSLDFSTVLFANVVFCIFLYGISYCAAPFVAKFYANDTLTPLIRVQSTIILISGVLNVQQAFVSKKMMFKKFFWSTLGGTLAGAIVGISMAFQGYGVWALVGQQLTNMLLNSLILWMTIHWIPTLQFSLRRLKQLYSYGWKLLASSLIGTLYEDLRQLIIGKIYTSTDLAYYNKGMQFPNLIVTNVNSSINSVLFPVLSSKQDDLSKVRNMTRRAIKVSSFIMWPCMFGLMAVGEPLIELLLTEKWLPCVPYMYIFCFTKGMLPIQTANLNAIKAVGRSDLYLKLEIIKKTIGLILIVITMNISVWAMALSAVVYSLIVSLINAFPNRKILGYSYIQQIKDMLPSILASAGMFFVVSLVPEFSGYPVLDIGVKVLVGCVFYVAVTLSLKMESAYYILDLLKKTLFRK